LDKEETMLRARDKLIAYLIAIQIATPAIATNQIG
jgi:hypothetical protein